MKLHVWVMGIFLACGANAANIEWGGFCFVEDSYFMYGSGLVCRDSSGWWLFDATIGIQIEVLAGSEYGLKFYNDCNYVSQNWIRANDGDIVRYDTTRDLGSERYLTAYGIDNNDYIGPTEIIVQPDSSMYLAFVYQATASMDIYGWVELTVDSNGNLRVANSAYDLEGGPMVVGGGAWNGNIPEPSGGILLLIGVAVLGLRRRAIRPIAHNTLRK
ncbi:MAG: PEP-CTERM sorting domain-containing protein [Kiritimatiellae bacterium]|nr:PEP-CTERM sorting domain-containing protein [Kiritimatiellia bacterium]